MNASGHAICAYEILLSFLGGKTRFYLYVFFFVMIDLFVSPIHICERTHKEHQSVFSVLHAVYVNTHSIH